MMTASKLKYINYYTLNQFSAPFFQKNQTTIEAVAPRKINKTNKSCVHTIHSHIHTSEICRNRMIILEIVDFLFNRFNYNVYVLREKLFEIKLTKLTSLKL